jgi:hypothetical protein
MSPRRTSPGASVEVRGQLQERGGRKPSAPQSAQVFDPSAFVDHAIWIALTVRDGRYS